VGYNPDQPLPSTFLPLEVLTPSTPSSESDLNTTTESPNATEAEQGSEDEVEELISQVSALPHQNVNTQSSVNASAPTPTTALTQPIDTLPAPAQPLVLPPIQPQVLFNPIQPAPVPAPALVQQIPALAPPALPQAPINPVQPAPQQQHPQLANPVLRMPLADLPACMERSAPAFNDTQPQDLERYFADLEILLNRYNIVLDQEWKQALLKYLTIRTENL